MATPRLAFLPGNGNVGLLKRDLGGPLRGVERGVDALAELCGADEEEVPPLAARDEDVVLVLALLLEAVAEGGDAVAVLAVVVPLALVAEAVRALADAEAGALVVLPLAHVRLRHVRVQLLVLERERVCEGYIVNTKSWNGHGYSKRELIVVPFRRGVKRIFRSLAAKMSGRSRNELK